MTREEIEFVRAAFRLCAIVAISGMSVFAIASVYFGIKRVGELIDALRHRQFLAFQESEHIKRLQRTAAIAEEEAAKWASERAERERKLEERDRFVLLCALHTIPYLFASEAAAMKWAKDNGLAGHVAVTREKQAAAAVLPVRRTSVAPAEPLSENSTIK